MAPKQKTWLIWLLIVTAGSIPLSVFFLENDQALDANIASLPSRSLPLLEQQAQAFEGLFVKPVYMMLSLIIILALLGQKRADIAALEWGQVAFLAGETFCAINFYFYKHESILSEYLHSYGMVLAFGFTSFALLEGLDTRLMRLTSSRSACEALHICGRCTRHEPEECKARAVARFVIPMLAFLTFIPSLSALQPDAYAVSIFGFPYSYTRFDIYELYERRILPALALIAFVLAYLPLFKKGEPPIPFTTKVFVCAGIGAFGFSLFRVTLNAIFANNLVWFEFWEEATELMFVSAVGFVLWKFKVTLLEKERLSKFLGFN